MARVSQRRGYMTKPKKTDELARAAEKLITAVRVGVVDAAFSAKVAELARVAGRQRSGGPKELLAEVQAELDKAPADRHGQLELGLQLDFETAIEVWEFKHLWNQLVRAGTVQGPEFETGEMPVEPTIGAIEAGGRTGKAEE